MVKRLPWLSLWLLMVAYASFGWFLSTSDAPGHSYILVIGWIWLISEALIDPLTLFTRFITRWFKSDTVAFLSIFMLAALAAIILFWLHIFLYILTIITTESLARIDVQTSKFSDWQAFWILSTVSLLGLGTGWTASVVAKNPAILYQLPVALMELVQ